MAVFSGCTPYVEAPSAGVRPFPGGSLHRVARGETLWRIARSYGVELEDLVRANQISDVSRVKAGQGIVIPPRDWKAPDRNLTAGAPRKEAAPSEEFLWPVRGRVISIFGMRRGAGVQNKGIDIQAPEGVQVLASRSGRVSFVHENLPGFGKTIILEHPDGFATVYAYVGQILIRQGEDVSQAQVIARVGRSGRLEFSALHFEIRRNQ
ncbi:MAG: peptidoglycan DD-metalloendopeptidase family protein, partial [Candidatus Omnitrophica bacterium]|nr:peptidoglycan DD-metalloendopeptidase family protein [Candidatus Omnitrophota bacterium]